jgi:chromosome segregation ATPase
MATSQQRQQYETCSKTMDRVRETTRDMVRTADGKAFSADQARQQRDRLQEHLQTMEQQHQQVMQGLGVEQRSTIQQRAKTMDQIRDRIHTRIQEMNQELAKTSPDPPRVAEHARVLEREMNEWQKQYREFGEDLGLRQ